jgi:hypothetical protein
LQARERLLTDHHDGPRMTGVNKCLGGYVDAVTARLVDDSEFADGDAVADDDAQADGGVGGDGGATS